ncbi:MAG: decarboxylating 6-phosphogluconate dehydrogenase [Actinomycetota bacterium]|nr:decarboxylating 6-phosphogluconate dehydrogenase [Actinomycetota bacterium]
MKIGMVGLGRMGSNMSLRLLQGGHEVVAHDVSPDAIEKVASQGAMAAPSLQDLVHELDGPRAVWVMVPAGVITEETIAKLASLLDKDDVIIDGGNSRYTDTQRRAKELADKGIHFLDSGTSGGIWGLAEGYCLMVGGATEAIGRLEPIFRTLAPENGYAHVGQSGAGHFTKMVHNGIEYGLMQAYAEGFDLLVQSDFDIDLPQVAELWRHGSVVRSWMLDLAAHALSQDPGLESLRGFVEDSGEGRWTVQAAVDHAVPMPAISAALFARFSSRQPNSFQARVLAALRKEFGGHQVTK